MFAEEQFQLSGLDRRPTEQIALKRSAAQTSEKFLLHRSLDSFRHNIEIERAAKRDDGGNDRLIFSVARQGREQIRGRF